MPYVSTYTSPSTTPDYLNRSTVYRNLATPTSYTTGSNYLRRSSHDPYATVVPRRSVGSYESSRYTGADLASDPLLKRSYSGSASNIYEAHRPPLNTYERKMSTERGRDLSSTERTRDLSSTERTRDPSPVPTVKASFSQPESPYRRLRSREDSKTPTDFDKKEKVVGSDVIEFVPSGNSFSFVCFQMMWERKLRIDCFSKRVLVPSVYGY